jgi:hypothetical protein
MTDKKRIVGLLLFAPTVLLTFAQGVTSPYTRYGFGDLSNQSIANSRGMGGIAYGMRDNLHANPMNPASYTAVDSLTMLFDGGFSVQNTNYIDGIAKLNVANASFDYLTMQFRLRKGLAMTMGFLPYSNIGYAISQYTPNTDHPEASYTQSFTGSGGLHQAFLGVGVAPWKSLSIGANISYLWGSATHARSVTLDGTGANQFIQTQYVNIKDIKLDLGVQYSSAVGRRGQLTVGAVFSPKQGLNNTGYLQTVTGTSSSTQTQQRDTVATYQLPMSLGFGLTYIYDRRLTVGIDYTLQKWSDVQFMGSPDKFYDRTKIAIGAEYLPRIYATSYWSAIKYQVGAFYSLPYYKVSDGVGDAYRAAKEFGLTAGFSIPTPSARSSISLAFQYVKVKGARSRMMDENIFRLSLGITFNERWFEKTMVR